MLKRSANWLRSEKRQKYQHEWCFPGISGSRKDAFSGRYTLVEDILFVHFETIIPFCLSF